ncbi:MAG TPA: DJ-1 family protein [Ruminococcaceae bacterium]|nr:DJ-1 family protein [Oscillospiraceae bacterium]
MFYLFLADGFEETEALAALDVMRRAKMEVATIGVTGEYVTSSHNVTVKADLSIDKIDVNSADGAVLPGGMPGTLNLEKSDKVLDCVKRCNAQGKPVCAICAAPSILGHLGILDGKTATCFPGFEKELKGASCTGAHVETDGNIVTAKGAGCAVEFGHAIVSLALSKEAADKVISDMQCL